MTYQSGPQIKESQKQFLYGTILGGSSIIKPDRGKNCYLAMRDHNETWLRYKIEVLKEFFKIDTNTVKKDKNTFRCYSVAYPIFNDIYKMFYKDGLKTVNSSILEILTDEAWMVWLLDSGRKSKRKAYLRTHKFGETGTKIICDYFNSLDCPCTVHLCRNRYEIIFNNQGSNQLFSVIEAKMPEFMKANFF